MNRTNFLNYLTGEGIFILPFHMENIFYECQFEIEYQVLDYLVTNDLIDISGIIIEEFENKEDVIDYLIDLNVLFSDDILPLIDSNIVSIFSIAGIFNFKYISIYGNNIELNNYLERG